MTSPLPSSSTRGGTSRVGVDLIHDIIDHRRVRTVFQPLVHLPTRQIVGYEALSRGPAGTALESPLALLDAARAVGRLSELDWTCRAAAAQAALDRHLDPSLTLLVNLEPETLGSSCPDNLWPVIAEARRRLHVIAEFTERALAADPSLLLSMAAGCARPAGVSRWTTSVLNRRRWPCCRLCNLMS